MSTTKAALKAAKAAVDAEKWDEVVTQAESVLAADSNNYFAKLFLGRAYQKQGKPDDAAQSYKSATEVKPEDTQGWLGLCNLYEDQGSKKVDEYREAALKVAELYAAADDKHRCQSIVDKIVPFAKTNGSTAQYKRALEALLPQGPVYNFLEGRILHPSLTYTRLAEITEDEEKQRINKEIGERRTRLGAYIGQVTTEVKREVYTNSNLEELYQNVIDWNNDDEIRREYEEKLLQRMYDTLIVLAGEHKTAKREQVLKTANGMVIIKHPFLLAWTVELEWNDVAAVQDLDVGVLREYAGFFPETSLGKVLNAYLECEISPFPPLPKDKDEEDEGEKATPLAPEDRLLLMTEGLEDGNTSVLAHRLAADYFLYLEEHESVVDVSRSGLKLLVADTQKSGLKLQDNKDALNSTLATALVHHQSPKNHPEAREIFNDILSRNPKNTSALIGLGLIMEEREEYDDAVSFLSQALEQDPSNIPIGAEAAWCDALRGNYGPALERLEDYLPRLKTTDAKSRDLRAQTLYRIGICIWELDPSKAARKDRSGAYAHFLAAIKTNVNYAPAYTSLGFYYADYAKDKKRARQCFQKAFELSSSEVEAAERLARAFADQKEWDIVEIVAQRVVDSGKVRPPPGSKKKGISWPFSALGVVQMNKQEYSQAIVSFLAALRISPNDYHSYVGLGESYHNSGRYNSASRTFTYAEEPHDGMDMGQTADSWFTKYMLANVNRELGEHDEAITGLREVLQGRPEEYGVLMALLQTFVERAWRCVEMGYFGQAADGAVQALELAQKIAEQSPHAFNLWKAVGDSCSVFAWVQDKLSVLPAKEIKQMLLKDIEVKELDLLADIDNVNHEGLQRAEDEDGTATKDHTDLAILAYKRAISSCARDVHAQAVAWYNLGWAEHRAYACSEPKSGKKFLRAAVRCFKRAIELEAGNSEFWNALGVVTTNLNPKVAQHSFVRSLHLNERSARTWTNLGVLYLLNNDHELAHQSFARAQSTDPDYPHAWLGEGLIALLMGDNKEALAHFTHAFEISDSSPLIMKRQYAVSVFDHLLADQSASSDISSLIQPLFALEQLHAQAPSDQEYSHLSSLLSERVGDHSSAISTLETLCTSCESDYEASESLSALARFAHAKADLARNQLAAHDYASASENAGTALDLSADAQDSGLEPNARRKLRLSAHLTAGLAAFYTQDMDSAIAMFRAALEESASDPDVICLLVQVLWAKGGEQEKTVAREQLFACVEQHENHVRSIVLLATMAALDDDTETLDAVRDDLQALRTSDTIPASDRDDINKLLSEIGALGADDAPTAAASALSEIQTSIMLAPNASGPWTALADFGSGNSDAEEGASYASQMALLNAQRAVPPHGDIDAGELAKAFAGTGIVRDAQTGVMLAPWERAGWESFAEAVSG